MHSVSHLLKPFSNSHIWTHKKEVQDTPAALPESSKNNPTSMSQQELKKRLETGTAAQLRGMKKKKKTHIDG